MSKTKLVVDYDYDFCLVGIVSYEKDYRLCWMLNNTLNIKLTKMEDHPAEHSKHSIYGYVREELFREYYMLANKGDSHHLVDEHKHIDYFLVVKGSLEEEEKRHMLELIKKSDMVSAAYLIDVHSLKSKHNLIL
jgi:hypothetical protein